VKLFNFLIKHAIWKYLKTVPPDSACGVPAMDEVTGRVFRAMQRSPHIGNIMFPVLERFGECTKFQDYSYSERRHLPQNLKEAFKRAKGTLENRISEENSQPLSQPSPPCETFLYHFIYPVEEPKNVEGVDSQERHYPKRLYSDGEATPYFDSHLLNDWKQYPLQDEDAKQLLESTCVNYNLRAPGDFVETFESHKKLMKEVLGEDQGKRTFEQALIGLEAWYENTLKRRDEHAAKLARLRLKRAAEGAASANKAPNPKKPRTKPKRVVQQVQPMVQPLVSNGGQSPQDSDQGNIPDGKSLMNGSLFMIYEIYNIYYYLFHLRRLCTFSLIKTINLLHS